MYSPPQLLHSPTPSLASGSEPVLEVPSSLSTLSSSVVFSSGSQATPRNRPICFVAISQAKGTIIIVDG